MAYLAVMSTVLLPRIMLARARRPLSDDRVAFMQWTLAVSPALVGFAATAAGAHRRVMLVGFGLAGVLVGLVLRSYGKAR